MAGHERVQQVSVMLEMEGLPVGTLGGTETCRGVTVVVSGGVLLTVSYPRPSLSPPNVFSNYTQ